MVISESCRHVGLLLCLFSFGRVMPGVIEIVEEQLCADEALRLTCRGLDTHIAVLDAWYTSAEHLPLSRARPTAASRAAPVVADLRLVHVYSSPRQDGLYEQEDDVENGTVYSVGSERTAGPARGKDGAVRGAPQGASGECSVPRFQNSYPSGRASENAKDGVWFSANVSINVRSPLSYRCTGVNHCSFLLRADHAAGAAATEGGTWGSGALYVKYACFDDAHSMRFCNRKVDVAASGPASEGYLRTPGYPHYYVGEAQCLWRLRAQHGQRLRLTLVDVSLRSVGPFESECTDYVSARDAVTRVQLVSTCEQPPLPRALESRSRAIDVLISARSSGAFPKRGVLMHYKSIGCVTPPAPPDGYNVYRESNVALYMCDVGAVFPDSRQRARAISCMDDNRWNDTVPNCIEDAAPGGSAANDSSKETSPGPKLTSNENNMVVDIVIPSLLIAALFIGNAFIVLIIYKYRKRKCDDEIEDEFNTIPLSNNGSAPHAAGNAV